MLDIKTKHLCCGIVLQHNKNKQTEWWKKPHTTTKDINVIFYDAIHVKRENVWDFSK